MSVGDLEAKIKAAKELYKVEQATLKNKKDLNALELKTKKDELELLKKKAVAIGEGNEGYKEAIIVAKSKKINIPSKL